MRRSVWGCALLLALAGCAESGPQAEAAAPARVPVVGLPCEGCEAVFEGMPAQLASAARLAPAGEPGEALEIRGTVRDARGTPAPGVIVYAYHTNARGSYPRGDAALPPMARRHGRLRGWAVSDSLGRYRFETIRPGSYPNGAEPAHVHVHVIEPGRCTYYIDDVVFGDDPLLTAEVRRRLAGRGGAGVTAPLRERGVWIVVRDIVLGANVPGYPARAD